MKARPEKDVLGNGVSEARDELLLGEQSFDAPLLSFQERIYEGGKVVKRELGLIWAWAASP